MFCNSCRRDNLEQLGDSFYCIVGHELRVCKDCVPGLNAAIEAYRNPEFVKPEPAKTGHAFYRRDTIGDMTIETGAPTWIDFLRVLRESTSSVDERKRLNLMIALELRNIGPDNHGRPIDPNELDVTTFTSAYSANGGQNRTP